MSTKRPAWWSAAALALLLGMAALAFVPVTTQQGVDFVVHSQRLPLYVKTLQFVDRDANYRALAARITAGSTTDWERTVAIFEWTRANVRDVPPGYPVVDDHVWHIVIRGYGTDDQKADVFTTVVVYAGIPAYWVYLERDAVKLPLSLIRLGGRWRVFDVANGLVVKNRAGEPVSTDDLAADPGLVSRVTGARTHGSRPYADYFAGFRAPAVPDTLRAELQMPWPRLRFEAARMVGLGGTQWDPRHGARPVR